MHKALSNYVISAKTHCYTFDKNDKAVTSGSDVTICTATAGSLANCSLLTCIQSQILCAFVYFINTQLNVVSYKHV